MEKAERQSNIELLRILTMCGVVILHYNNKTIGGARLRNRIEFVCALFFRKYFCVCG